MEERVLQNNEISSREKSRCFRFMKLSLIITLILVISTVLIVLIIAEMKFNSKTFLSLGIISLVGVLVFSLGLLATIKEHVPSLLVFSTLVIFYLLLFMYSRALQKPFLIVLRTLVLLFLSLASLSFAILIRDSRQLQQSRLACKERQQLYSTPYYIYYRNNV